MSDRKAVIVLISLGDNDLIQVFGGVKDMCNNHPEFSYNYLKAFKFNKPKKYKGWKIYKVNFRSV